MNESFPEYPLHSTKYGLRPYGVPPRGPCAVVGGYCVGGGLNVAPLPLSLILLLFLVPLVFLFCIFFVSALHFTLYILVFAAVIYLYCLTTALACALFLNVLLGALSVG